MSFHCFSLQFTCRARGRRLIPFWVTHTSTELSTKGQASGINSLLAWTYIKPLSTFFTLTTFQQWPRLGHPCPWRFVRIQLNKVLHDQSDLRANPAGNRGWTTRDLLTPHGACIFLWLCYLGPALLIWWSWCLRMKWRRREGRQHQLTALEISSDTRTCRDGGMILVHLLLLLTPSFVGRCDVLYNKTIAEGCSGKSLFRRWMHSLYVLGALSESTKAEQWLLSWQLSHRLWWGWSLSPCFLHCWYPHSHQKDHNWCLNSRKL